MTAKTGKYDGDQLFHAIFHDNYSTIVHFMYFPHHKVEATQALNGIPCILFEELLINPNIFITISGIEQSTMGIRDKYKCTFTEPNELHNEESMEGMFEGTVLTTLYLYQDPQVALKNKMSYFDEGDLQKSYTHAHGKYYETVNIASRSCHMGRKLQARKNTSSPPGFNIAPAEDPTITSGLTQGAPEDEDDSLMGGAYLTLDPEGDDISLR